MCKLCTRMLFLVLSSLLRKLAWLPAGESPVVVFPPFLLFTGTLLTVLLFCVCPSEHMYKLYSCQGKHTAEALPANDEGTSVQHDAGASQPSQWDQLRMEGEEGRPPRIEECSEMEMTFRKTRGVVFPKEDETQRICIETDGACARAQYKRETSKLQYAIVSLW